jgi:hypothetical protein
LQKETKKEIEQVNPADGLQLPLISIVRHNPIMKNTDNPM